LLAACTCAYLLAACSQFIKCSQQQMLNTVSCWHHTDPFLQVTFALCMSVIAHIWFSAQKNMHTCHVLNASCLRAVVFCSCFTTPMTPVIKIHSFIHLT